MRIESIKLKNFKSFRDTSMTGIPAFCAVIGANGVGKSTLFDVFSFLKDCLIYNVAQALQTRGGFAEVINRGTTPGEFIEIEIKFRLKIADVERLVTYTVKIGCSESGKPYVEREFLGYKRGRHGSPFHFLDFSRGKGYAISNEEDFDKKDEELEREQQSVAEDVLAIKGLGQFEKFKAANAFRQSIENWHVSDFDIDQARGSKDARGYAEHLSTSGDNLQLVAKKMRDNHKEIFTKIIAAMRRRVPGIDDIEPIATEDGRILLRFKDSSFDQPFIDSYVSDGTIKMFAYLVLLYDPEPHPLLCVEEPDNQLHHQHLGKLAEEFRLYALRGEQVFVSSHSPDFLDATRLEEVYLLTKENGYTEIRRARDDKQVAAYMKEGDKMGCLWQHGIIEDIR